MAQWDLRSKAEKGEPGPWASSYVVSAEEKEREVMKRFPKRWDERQQTDETLQGGADVKEKNEKAQEWDEENPEWDRDRDHAWVKGIMNKSQIGFAGTKVMKKEHFGFKYVLVPANPDDAIQELRFALPVSVESDPFQIVLGEYFQLVRAGVDKGVALVKLNIRARSEPYRENISAPAGPFPPVKVDTLPLLGPHRHTGYQYIVAYLESQRGISHKTTINTRASELVKAATLQNQQLRGDVFFGRCFDKYDIDQNDPDLTRRESKEESLWGRVDFKLADCGPDADWVLQARDQRGAQQIHRKFEEGKLNNTEGETDAYKWIQTGDEVEITFKREDIQRSDTTLVRVTFHSKKIKVEFKGQVLMEGSLQHRIDAESSTWTVSDGILQLTLAKTPCEAWTSVLAEENNQISSDDLIEKASEDQQILHSSRTFSGSGTLQGILPSVRSPFVTQCELSDDCVENFIPSLFALGSVMLSLTSVKTLRSLHQPLWGWQEPLMQA